MLESLSHTMIFIIPNNPLGHAFYVGGRFIGRNGPPSPDKSASYNGMYLQWIFWDYGR